VCLEPLTALLLFHFCYFFFVDSTPGNFNAEVTGDKIAEVIVSVGLTTATAFSEQCQHLLKA